MGLFDGRTRSRRSRRSVEPDTDGLDHAGSGRASGPALSASCLTKRFGDRIAFRDVSFEIGYGEVFGFLGPNGAGKTTTVRTLGTLIAPSSGSATVAGLPLTPENGVEIRRRVSVMPESPGLYLRLSVIENLECFAELYRSPDAADRIDRALHTVSLVDRAGDACGTLSKGLRQRVALARALLGDPEILFLDEPTAGLDPAAARSVHELIVELSRRGVTIFLTTHRLEEAERLCDRVAILNTTLRTIGKPTELRDQLFARTLTVKTLAPLDDPGRVFGGLPAVDGFRQDGPVAYVLAVSDVAVAAPAGHPGSGQGRCRRAVDSRVAPLARGRLPRVDRRGREGARRMSVDSRQVRAIVRKELRDFRRNRNLTVGMAIAPVLFCVQPLVAVFTLDAAASTPLGHEHVLLYMLGIPALVPSFVAAYSVVGERQQGTLEPVLTTPIRSEDLLLGKALAALLPSLAVAYAVYGLYLACVELFADPAVASAIIRPPELLAQLCFTPLLAGWSIWVAVLISSRSNDIRVAQQFAMLASLPSIAVTTLVALNVIRVSLLAALVAAAALLLFNGIGWRLVSAMFDRERLITGTKG